MEPSKEYYEGFESRLPEQDQIDNDVLTIVTESIIKEVDEGIDEQSAWLYTKAAYQVAYLQRISKGTMFDMDYETACEVSDIDPEDIIGQAIILGAEYININKLYE